MGASEITALASAETSSEPVWATGAVVGAKEVSEVSTRPASPMA